MNRGIVRFGALCAAAAAGFVAAASAGAQDAPASLFGETVEVRVINLEVVVTDRQGLPVTGLGPGQFVLRVDGEPVPIEFFTEVRGGNAIEGAADRGAIPGVPQLAPGTPVGTSYLVFIDDFWAIERDRNHVLEKLIADLAYLRPEDRMAVVAFDGWKIDMLSSWSQSAPELERVLRKATGRKSLGLQRIAEDRRFIDDRRLVRSATGPRGFIDSTQMRLDVEERNYANILEEQVENVVSAAAAALRGFAKPPGRKVLLLLSGGWPYDVVDFVVNDYNRTVVESEISRGDVLFEPLIATANQLGYTIYGVDVPGLLGDTAINAEYGSASTFGERRQQFQRESNVQYSLEAVSRATGGEALINGQRDSVLSGPASDTRSYYWIGFTPPWEGSDSAHEVTVETAVEGLRVRSRSGYVDFSSRRETTMAVESVLLFGDRPDMQPLDVEIGKVEKSFGGTMKVPMTLRIPLDRLTLVPQGDRFAAEVELRIAALDERGGRSEVPVIPASLSMSGRPPAGAYATYTAVVQLRRAKNQVVLAISDPVSGAIYSARTEVAYK
jgi:VWFA-related protein